MLRFLAQVVKIISSHIAIGLLGKLDQAERKQHLANADGLEHAQML